MEIVFFCENKNQIFLSNLIKKAGDLGRSHNIKFLFLEWRQTYYQALIQAHAELEVNVPLVSLYSAVDRETRKHFIASKATSSNFKNLFFTYFKNAIFSKNTVVVHFNDASERGSSLAYICNNLGIPRVLVQDGFLNFVSKTGCLHLEDQNFNWGKSFPEHIIVWGSKLKSAIIERHGNSPDSIHIGGLLSENCQLPACIDHSPMLDEPIKVLWADQPFIDQNKVNRERWLSEFGEIGRTLTAFTTTLRLHPSTTEQTRVLLGEHLPESYHPLVVPKLAITDGNEFKGYDVVVLNYSSVFIPCLQQGIPCVVYATSSSNIELPIIKHPLLVYCRKLENLKQCIRDAAKLCISESTPPDIFEYIAPTDGAKAAADIILHLCVKSSNNSISEPLPLKNNIELLNNYSQLSSRSLLLLSSSFGTRTGVGKPICSFLERVDCFSDIDCMLSTCTHLSLSKVIPDFDILLINGLGAAIQIPIEDMLKTIQIAIKRKIPVVLYVHETEYVVKALLNRDEKKFIEFQKRILPQLDVLVCTHRQGELYHSLGARKIRVVGNTVGDFSPQPHTPDAKQPIILMVGTIQKRKGATLFSLVADRAKREKLPWRFVWLGSDTSISDGCYKSKHVEWMGHVFGEEVKLWLSRSSVFFLSSIDEPFSLAVGEALLSGVPCAVYSKVGYADVITWLNAGKVFNQYNPHQALETLKVIMQTPDDFSVDTHAIKKIIGLDNFCCRMINVLGEISLSSAGNWDNRFYCANILEISSSSNVRVPIAEKRISLKRRIALSIEKLLPERMSLWARRFLHTHNLMRYFQ